MHRRPTSRHWGIFQLALVCLLLLLASACRTTPEIPEVLEGERASPEEISVGEISSTEAGVESETINPDQAGDRNQADLEAATAAEGIAQQDPAPDSEPVVAPVETEQAAERPVPVVPKPVNPAPPPVPVAAKPVSPAPPPVPVAPKPVNPTPPPMPVAPKPVDPAPPAAAPGPEPATVQASTMNLDNLKDRLRQTKAIGVFTKLELKSQVNDLLGDIEKYHASRNKLSLSQLEEHFNLLVMKLLVLLEKDDPQLSREIARARPALWSTLADPVQFSSIKGP